MLPRLDLDCLLASLPACLFVCLSVCLSICLFDSLAENGTPIGGWGGVSQVSPEVQPGHCFVSFVRAGVARGGEAV